jgi:hypothetical protein
MTNPVPIAQDTWGALSIPTQPGYSFTPIAQAMWVEPARIAASDPCLAVILDFLATAINVDGILDPAWQDVQSLASDLVLKRVFAHNPGENVFQVSYLPALYLWRETGSLAYAADEWNRDTSKVTGLWVLPLGGQSQQKTREPFMHALIEGIVNAIERGRTPSWLQPTDTEARAQYEGSVFYPFAGFESFTLRSFKRSKLLVPKGPQESIAYPAVEMSFDLEENQIRGITRFFVMTSGSATLYDASGSSEWSANVAYAINAMVFPPQGVGYQIQAGNGYVYTCTTAGTSANVQPLWPTTIGQTVQDGSVVWTCTGTMAPNGNVTDSGPL